MEDLKTVITDTSDFSSIDYGDVLFVGGRNYLVKGHEQERRFGMTDPKYWVKRVIDLKSGEKKIVKLAFFETFDVILSGVRIRCFRNPEKEGRILELVRDQPSFMQGTSCRDSMNNNVRVLDIVQGPSFYHYIESLAMEHEPYFHEIFPGILKKIVRAFKGIRFLHANGYRHGDIRNDHIIMERDSGNYVWIDFDYDYETSENPFSLDLYGLGNILLYSVGKGFHDKYMIQNDISTYGNLREQMDTNDFSILHQWRFLNLRKLYPYIPMPLNDILAHFSVGAELFYESADEIIEDVARYIDSFFE